MGHTIRKVWTVVFGPVSTTQPGPFKPALFAPIRYLSADHIVRYPICQWCSYRSSSTCQSPIVNLNNIRFVTVENTWCRHECEWYFIATQWILIAVQTVIAGGERAPKIASCTYRLCCVSIRSQFLNWSKNCRNHDIDPGSNSNPANNLQFSVWFGYWPSASYSVHFPWLILTWTRVSFLGSTRTASR